MDESTGVWPTHFDRNFLRSQDHPISRGPWFWGVASWSGKGLFLAASIAVCFTLQEFLEPAEIRRNYWNYCSCFARKKGFTNQNITNCAKVHGASPTMSFLTCTDDGIVRNHIPGPATGHRKKGFLPMASSNFPQLWDHRTQNHVAGGEWFSGISIFNGNQIWWPKILQDSHAKDMILAHILTPNLQFPAGCPRWNSLFVAI